MKPVILMHNFNVVTVLDHEISLKAWSISLDPESIVTKQLQEHRTENVPKIGKLRNW